MAIAIHTQVMEEGLHIDQLNSAPTIITQVMDLKVLQLKIDAVITASTE